MNIGDIFMNKITLYIISYRFMLDVIFKSEKTMTKKYEMQTHYWFLEKKSVNQFW